MTTTSNPTLNEFIEQMRQLCLKNNHSVNISYNSEMALAKFYLKSDLVAERILYRL